MKLKSVLNLVMVLVLTQFMFACNSAKYYEFAANKQAPYHQAKQKAAPEAEAGPTLIEVAVAAADEKAEAKESEPVLEASIAAPAASPKKIAPVAKAVATEEAVEETVTLTEAEALAMAKERIKSMTKAEKKELRAAFKQDRGVSGTSIIKIILAVILPPLAVFLHDGIGTSFWINIILTLLFFLPGIIHALLVVTNTI